MINDTVDMIAQADVTPAATAGKNTFADTVLKAAAGLWFVTAVIGQWIFVAFIVSFYGGAAMRRDFEGWNTISKQLGIGNEIPHGYVAGDIMGNIMLGLHLLLAAIIIFGLPLQLVPWMRNRFPAVHRWSGRTVLVSICIIVSAGFYLILARGSVSGPYFMAGNILNAVLILVAAIMALRYALAGRPNIHRRWAMRLYLLVNGVWFLRVGFFLWMMINQGAAGHNNTFTGPFDMVAAFAHTLLPVAILEVYLRIKDQGSTTGKYTMAAGLFLLTVGMGVGTFGASAFIWIPNM